MIGWIFIAKELIGIGIALWRLCKDFYERKERASFLKEVKSAINESRNTLDNSRLVNLFDPTKEPFPRKVLP